MICIPSIQIELADPDGVLEEAQAMFDDSQNEEPDAEGKEDG